MEYSDIYSNERDGTQVYAGGFPHQEDLPGLFSRSAGTISGDCGGGSGLTHSLQSFFCDYTGVHPVPDNGIRLVSPADSDSLYGGFPRAPSSTTKATFSTSPSSASSQPPSYSCWPTGKTQNATTAKFSKPTTPSF